MVSKLVQIITHIPERFSAMLITILIPLIGNVLLGRGHGDQSAGSQARIRRALITSQPQPSHPAHFPLLVAAQASLAAAVLRMLMLIRWMDVMLECQKGMYLKFRLVQLVRCIWMAVVQ